MGWELSRGKAGGGGCGGKRRNKLIQIKLGTISFELQFCPLRKRLKYCLPPLWFLLRGSSWIRLLQRLVESHRAKFHSLYLIRRLFFELLLVEKLQCLFEFDSGKIFGPNPRRIRFHYFCSLFPMRQRINLLTQPLETTECNLHIRCVRFGNPARMLPQYHNGPSQLLITKLSAIEIRIKVQLFSCSATNLLLIRISI